MYLSTIPVPRNDTHIINYTGGDQSYDLSQYGSNDTINFNIASNAYGNILFSSNNVDPLSALFVTVPGANNSSTGPIGIDLGNLQISKFIVVSGLSSNSYLKTNSTSNYQSMGLSPDNRFNVYSTEAYGHYYQILSTTLVLNGNVNINSSLPVTRIDDYGGNETWAGAAPIKYSVLNLPNTQVMDSRLIGGSLSGNYTIDNLDPSTTASSPSSPHVDIILNVYQQPTDKTSYTVVQNSSNNFNLFQQTGNLVFNGKNTLISLNNPNIAQTVSNLTLTGNDQVWNGNGAANITTQNTDNIIVNSGKGSLVINNENNKTQGTLSIGNNGLGTGSINYRQGSENVTITSQSTNMLATLGTGTASIDLQNYTTNNTNGTYSITLGSGNAVFNNFTDSAGINPQSNNHIYLGNGVNIQNQVYSQNNTIFTLSSGNQIIFTNTDLVNQNPFG